MYQFIFQTLFMVSLGAIVYIIARAIPRVGEEEQSAERAVGESRVAVPVALERIDRILGETLEKTLRRVKVLILKTEGVISRSLEKKRKFEGESAEKGKQSLTLFESRENGEATPPTTPASE